MKAKHLPRKIGAYALTGFLTVGVIIAFGLLSASGMMLVTPSMLFVGGAFAFGGAVEGEVFGQEIFGGLHDLVLLGKQGYRALIVDALDQYLKTQQELPGFLGEYQRLKKYLRAVQGYKLTDTQKQEKMNAKKRLQHMQRFFAGYVRRDEARSLFPYENDEVLSAAIQNIKQQMPAFRAKMTVLRIALPISILCGAGFCFATAASLPAALALIGASMSFMVWPLAVMAAIGYTFLIFHTAKDILFSDSFRKWKASIKKWFIPGAEGVTLKFVLKAAGIAIVAGSIVALCVMGTLATAGTWWLAVKHGAKLIPYLHNAANVIRSILTPFATFGNFVFSVFNSFESLHLLIKTIQNTKPVQHLKNQWQQLRATENWAQILNPFRFAAKVIQKSTDTVFLLGHVLASGTARDQFMNISPTILAVTTAGSELSQDVTFFFEEGKKTMAQKLVTVLISPLLFLAASWQCFASRVNAPERQVTFKQALKDAFGIVTKPVYAGDDAPAMSASWRQAEIIRRFKKEEKRLDKVVINQELAQQKKAVMTQLKANLLAAHADDHVILPASSSAVLHQYRLFNNNKPTDSEQFADKMVKRFTLSIAAD